jgi:hypothetical protein
MIAPITAVILMPTKLSRVIKARDPKFQNDIERASALVTIADTRPTTAVKMAETAIPTMINANDESCDRRFANLNVSEVAANAPNAPHAIAPIDPTCTTPVRTANTVPSDAPAVVPNIEGSANALLQAPCAINPARAKDAPTINAAVTRGIRICHKISLLPGEKSADQKLSICAVPT